MSYSSSSIVVVVVSNNPTTKTSPVKTLASKTSPVKTLASKTSPVKTLATKTSPVKIVNPLEVYTRQQLEEAQARYAALQASKPLREAAEKAKKADNEKKKRIAEERAIRLESIREKKMLEKESRLAKLHAAYNHQKKNGIEYTLTIGGCAKFVRPEEKCFFEDHHVPRQPGMITCSICNREKQANILHDPTNPIGDMFPCFMCSKPVGWIYYCPDCSWKNRK